MLKKTILFLFCLCTLTSEEIHIDVTDPVHKDGVLFTHKGGVIQTGNMRVQARILELKEDQGQKILFAKESLLLVYGKKFFVGDSFSYNFSTREGVLENGVCSVEGVFAGGKKIIFHANNTLTIENSFVTTSDNKNMDWAIRAKEAHINERYQIKANQVTLAVFNTPVFYYPSYSMGVHKKFKKEPTVRYRIFLEKGQGPLFLVRYKLWDSDGFKAFWRGEYRIKRGVGTALEFDYEDPDKQLFKFASRNFYAYDTFYNDLDPKKYKSRYRIQGSFDGMSENKKLETFGRWDALSDRNMREDFPTQLFELDTLERTEGFVKGRYDYAFTSLYVRPRINSFQGFKQELPTFKIAVKPYAIPKTGVIFENYFKFAYLDYVYADKLESAVPDFRSGRLETVQSLVSPFQLSFLHVTPKVGFQGIYYSNGPHKNNPFQALFHYDLSTYTSLEKSYSLLTHEVKPYVEFQGLTTPTEPSKNIYIFGVQDGYHTLNQFKLGLKNSFFRNDAFSPLPRFSGDLYAYNFYEAHTFSKAFPKGYLDLIWNYPKLSFQTNLGWNFEKNTFDHTNFGLSWTLNEYFAASLELRNRGKYEWKKDDFTNYMLDVARPISELVHSPLSDERTSIFMRWHLQFAPLWTVQISNHVGWRPNQSFYHESKFDFYTILSNTWRLRLSYMRTTRTNQFSFGITLI